MVVLYQGGGMRPSGTRTLIAYDPVPLRTVSVQLRPPASFSPSLTHVFTSLRTTRGPILLFRQLMAYHRTSCSVQKAISCLSEVARLFPNLRAV